MLFRPSRDFPTGRIVTWMHESQVLANNPLQDPIVRAHPVYLPPGYDESTQRFPVLWSLAAYTNAGPGQVGWRNHGESLPSRLDRLISEGTIGPVVVVFPDCYTSLGGNQYVDTPAMGRYATYLIEELIPGIDAAFRTIPDWRARGAFGKSSGGFGALHLAMAHPEVFGAVASHAGDCGFDRVYMRDFPTTCDVLARYKGDRAEFIRAFWRAKRPGHADFHALMTLCLGASYSPDRTEPLGFSLPFDLHTCELNEEVWAKWLAFDPIHRAPTARTALQRLSGLWIDVGFKDQYFIHYGSRALHRVLAQSEITHHYEEFDGTHSGIDWRLDLSIPFLVNQLAG